MNDITSCRLHHCELPVSRNGLCNGHYKRYLKGLSLDTPIRGKSPAGSSPTCSVIDCGKPLLAQAYCAAHLRRHKRGDDMEVPVRNRTLKPKAPQRANSYLCDYCGKSFEFAGGKRRYCLECSPPGRVPNTIYRYGIPYSVRTRMLEAQQRICAVPGCSAEATHLDHWHGCPSPHPAVNGCTHCVRALVCGSCNVKIGIVEAGLRGVLDFLKSFPDRTDYSPDN